MHFMDRCSELFPLWLEPGALISVSSDLCGARLLNTGTCVSAKLSLPLTPSSSWFKGFFLFDFSVSTLFQSH